MIAAAGSGQRLGAGGPKAFVEVAGAPLIEWSLRALRAAGSIGAIVVAVPPGLEARFEGAEVIAGGATRAESVRLAMRSVQSDLVVVHDAARPLATAELFDRVVTRLSSSDADGVIAAAPVADTLKQGGEGGEVQRTVDRSGLWAAQTPQAFRSERLRQAQAAGDLEAATDEAWLIERAAGRVLLEPVDGPNLKVTTSADLAVAEALLGARS